jgi:hypothetical protein
MHRKDQCVLVDSRPHKGHSYQWRTVERKRNLHGGRNGLESAVDEVRVVDMHERQRHRCLAATRNERSKRIPPEQADGSLLDERCTFGRKRRSNESHAENLVAVDHIAQSAPKRADVELATQSPPARTDESRRLGTKPLAHDLIDQQATFLIDGQREIARTKNSWDGRTWVSRPA